MTVAPVLVPQYVMGFRAQRGMGIVAPALPLAQRIETVGYAPTTWIVAAMVWAGALAPLVWRPESPPRPHATRSVAPH